MGEAASLWLHLLAVTVWIGPQIFLFVVAIPAIRTIADMQTRVRATRMVTTRFGWLGGGAMLVIIVTGVGNLFQIDGYTTSELLNGDIRFARIFWEKMVLVALAVTLIGLHTFLIGPRQLQLMEQVGTDPAEQRNIQRLSLALSSIGLLASVGALYLGAVLGNHEYSLVPE